MLGQREMTTPSMNAEGNQVAPTTDMAGGGGPIEQAAAPAAPAQEAAPEAAAEPQAKPESQQDPELRRAWAQLSRRERALVRREAELKQQAQQTELTSKEYGALRQLAEKAKTEGPLALLEIGDHLGIPFEGVIDALAQYGREPTPEEKIAAMERRLQEKEERERREREDWEARAREEAEKQSSAQVEAKIDAYKSKLTEAVKSAPEQYELISLSRDPGELLWDVQLNYFKRYGEHLSDQELLQFTEQFLEQEETKKVAASKKLQRALGGSAQPPHSAPVTSGGGGTTLTSRMSSDAAVRDPQWPADEEESRRKAATLLRWD